MFPIQILFHVTSYIPVCVFVCLMAYPLGRAVRGVGLQALDCWTWMCWSLVLYIVYVGAPTTG